MYGMLLESAMHFGPVLYGEALWETIRTVAECKNIEFTAHLLYSDNILLKLADACAQVLGTAPTEDFLILFGKWFIRYCSTFGYDKILKITGRYFCQFLQEMNNIHSQIRFSFPKMKAPSLILISHDNEGAILQYKSSREGFTHFLIGQLLEVARVFYDLDLSVRVINDEDPHCVDLRLEFENHHFMNELQNRIMDFQRPELPSINIELLLPLFPFGLLLDASLTIISAGEKLQWLLGTRIIRSPFQFHFTVVRPKVELSWDSLVAYRWMTWEMESKSAPKVNIINGDDHITTPTNHSDMLTIPTITAPSGSRRGSILNVSRPNSRRGSFAPPWVVRKKSVQVKGLMLKGQMYLLMSQKMVFFLCMPLIENTEEMQDMGLYLNDLSMHDSSRDMVMFGWHNFSRLEIMYQRAERYSNKLENLKHQQEEWKVKGDDLLYSMLPKKVADVIRKGTDAIATCQSFGEVSILFAQVSYKSDEDSMSPFEIVKSYNDVYSQLDRMTENYRVFKVETVGDVYMVVSGAPEYYSDHVTQIAALALHIIKGIRNTTYSIRIGIHIGPVVAGVVGLRLPRYCLFGDTVNTASRMQSKGHFGRVHISTETAKRLEKTDFDISPRGKMIIKGKGELDTFWLDGYKEIPASSTAENSSSQDLKEKACDTKNE